MGTPDFSVPTLKSLMENTNLLLVVTQPDKVVGRKREIVYSPVKKLALENNISIFQPIKIRLDYQKIIDLKPDLIITCAYGQIIPKELLACPKYGAINVHASLLPKYRGSAPINWAIINGETKTGITLMYMDEHMDTGDIIAKVETDILNDETYGSLYHRLSLLGSNLLIENLDDIINNKVKRVKQEDKYATLAPMLKREDEHLLFTQQGEDIINKINGLNPIPSAYIILNDEEIKVLKAEFKRTKVNSISKVIEVSKSDLGISCKDGIIYLKEVLPSGKKIMPIKVFLNGQNKDKLLDSKID